MPTSNMSYIEELYLWAVQEVICHYANSNPTVSPDESASPVDGLAAMIGFGAEHLNGSSVLMSDVDAVRALSGFEEIDHLDWLGELNNQVVGRLKNKMVRHSVSVQMSTPVVTSGSSLDFSSKCDHSSRWIVQWEGGTLTAFLSLNVSPELEFAPPEAESVSDEGSLIFF